MKNFKFAFCLFLLLFAWFAPETSANFNGEVDWRYAHFTQDSDRNENMAASYFTQRYSLMYSSQGLLADGRAGYYDVGLGAEWAAFDSELGTTEVSKNSAKVLYNGRILFAPGGLPFRLEAYSYDLQNIQLLKTSGQYSLSPNAQLRNADELLSSNIVTDLQNGQTIVSGIQFIGGIRNGSYLGEFRELLSRWPRLLIDYRDVYRRDMHSDYPQNYRDRNLAFVSLNKKDNWFHYRIRSHVDYLRPKENTRDETIMLGTVDHMLKRQWIDLTNWIRISVDGSYTIAKDYWQRNDTKRFDVNFFTTMYRQGFDASSFVNLQREEAHSGITQRLDVPVYFNKSFGPETSVRTALQLWQERKTHEGDLLNKAGAYYARARLQAYKLNRIQVDPTLELEVDELDHGQAAAVRGRVEVYSNARNRQKVSWHGAAGLASFSGQDELNRDNALLEAEVSGGLTYLRNANLAIGLEQSLLYAEGFFGTQSTHYIGSQVARGFSDPDESVSASSLLRSKSGISLRYAHRSGVSNSFSLFYEFQNADTGTLNTVEVRHSLGYQSQRWRFRLENIYKNGDENNNDLKRLGNNADEVASFSGAKEQFSHQMLAEFSPNKFWKNRLDAKLIWSAGGSNTKDWYLRVRQRMSRTFYAGYSARYRLADISQSIEFEQFDSYGDRRNTVFRLSGNYYPTRYWRLGAAMAYNTSNFENYVMTYSLSTDLDFPLFKVNFNYDYGITDYENRVAHRYEVNVKKTF